MRDSQREPGAYPRRNPSGAMPNQSRPRPRPQPTGQSRPPARRSSMAGPDPAPRSRPLLNHNDLPPGRPRLPSAQETREEQFERTERLRALRQDFLDHAQTKIKPQKPRNVWIAVPLTGVLLIACIVGIIAVLQLRPTIFGNAGQPAATQFMAAMQQKNYTAAYADCASSVQETFTDHSGALNKTDFVQQAQTADQVGAITSYSSAGSNSTDANNQQYTFSVTRKGQKPINVTIGVTKGNDGSWKVSSIDNALFPTPPPPQVTPTTTPTGNLNLPGNTPLDGARRIDSR
ncbi:MAG TPA: hypothetical protein VKT82_05600 [Ktedonobacterales bacterium]|nr:hypothetical protein [Ktedonobacterales bacterium]